MKQVNIFLAGVILISAFLLSACGGGGGGGSTGTGTSSSTVNTGSLIDSNVAGMNYRTATQSGTTSALGEYMYLTGELVTFSIGGFDFPPVTAKGVVTPLDLANSKSMYDRGVVNIARLLQTLDDNGDPADGITIGLTAHDAAETLLAINFSDDMSFETDVASLVTNSGSSNISLISSSAALDHLGPNLVANDDTGVVAGGITQLVAGSWRIIETIGANTCNEPTGAQPAYTVQVSQRENVLTVTTGSRSFVGTVVNNRLGWTGSYPEDGGTTTITAMNLLFSEDGSSISGNTSWTFTDGSTNCGGSTAVSGQNTTEGSTSDSNTTVTDAQTNTFVPKVSCCSKISPVPGSSEGRTFGGVLVQGTGRWSLHASKGFGYFGTPVPDTHLRWSYTVDGVTRTKQGSMFLHIEKLFTQSADWEFTVTDPDNGKTTVFSGTLQADYTPGDVSGKIDQPLCIQNVSERYCDVLGDPTLVGLPANPFADSNYLASGTCEAIHYSGSYVHISSQFPGETGLCTYRFSSP